MWATRSLPLTRAAPRCAVHPRVRSFVRTLTSDAAAHSERARAISPVVQAAVQTGLLPPSTALCPTADLYDLDALDARLAEMRTAFHEPFFAHCLAVKANPTRGVLARAVATGLGLECASMGEVMHSVELGSKVVVFDSPCKSRDQLRDVLVHRSDVYVNIDNEQEIADIEELLRESPGLDLTARVGIRINPVTGGGSIASVSTAGRESKFGLPLTPETRDRLVGLFKAHRWLQGVHIHVGSQGIAMAMLQAGARTLLGFVSDVEAACGAGAIKVIDIGGGLPTSYTEDAEAFTFAQYRHALEDAAPELFSGRYRIITEFGRCILTKPGVTLSRVAVVKGAPWHPETPLAVAHVGSNQFVREAYLGDTWRHRFTALAPDGQPHPGGSDMQIFDIAGPLCFQGDYLGRKHSLPQSLGAGDILVMHDTGSYTLAMYSRYNSRQASPVYGYRHDAHRPGGYSFTELKGRESYQETLAFWGHALPVEV